MERHDALQDLSRDHHRALKRAQELRRAGTAEGAFSVREAAERFVTFWDEEAAHHFREEEEVLLPVLARHRAPTEDADVRQMLDDHAWFRDQVPKLRAALQADEGVEELAHALGDRLTRHVRLEERTLFERFQELFDEQDLEDVAARSRAYRERWRPDAIGPR